MPPMLLFWIEVCPPCLYFKFGLKKCIFLCTLKSLWVQDHANVSLCLFAAFTFDPSPFVLLFALTAEGYICVLVLSWFALWKR